MDTMIESLQQISNIIWGLPLLILLVGTGIYLTIGLKGLQIRKLGYSLYLGLIKRKEHSDQPGDISHFQALMTALSATVGTGNIAGVATAIVAGGPGALFWMWITGLFGMATKYAEAVLAVKYRIIDEEGSMSGGPMYYITKGLNARWLGILFAIFASIAAFGIGNMVQSNSVAQAVEHSFGIPGYITGIILMIMTIMVIIGGIKHIGRATGILVPFMIVFYVLSALLILVLNLDRLPDIIVLIFETAFTGHAATGGFLGATVMIAIQRGVSRGVFSNESGLGSSPIAAAAAKTKHPVSQALVSMTQTFIDTIVVCSLTGFVILVSGEWLNEAGYNGAQLTSVAFSYSLPGTIGGYIVTTGLILFAYSTILGWSYYGEKSIEFLAETGFKTKRFILILLMIILLLPLFIVIEQNAVLLVLIIAFYVFILFRIRKNILIPDLKTIIILYRGTFSVYVMVGTIFQLDLVWLLADIFNGMMAFPNLIGLLGLSGIVFKITKEYFSNPENQIL
ncbi:MAG: sodium:alanine symporter family protein [Calditrichaeota bacterium]|nr:MAG: sodium:alanine symporter family protein [Calditrichota bacterium]